MVFEIAAMVRLTLNNTKTPLAISLNLLSRLNDRDLRLLSIDRKVAAVLRSTAWKRVVLDKR